MRAGYKLHLSWYFCFRPLQQTEKQTNKQKKQQQQKEKRKRGNSKLRRKIFHAEQELKGQTDKLPQSDQFSLHVILTM